MRIQRAVALFTLLVILPASASLAGTTSAPDPDIAKLSALHGKAFDVAYLQAVIPTADEAVELALTATLYADHSALLRWNQDFTEREHGQVKKMLGLLDELSARPTLRDEGVATASVKQLRALRGEALERTYISLMTQHLDRTTALSKLAAQRADQPDVRSFAAGAAAADAKDSATLRGWVSAWYH